MAEPAAKRASSGLASKKSRGGPPLQSIQLNNSMLVFLFVSFYSLSCRTPENQLIFQETGQARAKAEKKKIISSVQC